MSEQDTNDPFIRVTIEDGYRYIQSFNISCLYKVKMTDEQRYIIMTLYHEAKIKSLFKNSERVVNDVTYGVEIL